MTGVEPATYCMRSNRSTSWATSPTTQSSYDLERATGIEPALAAWEAAVLPLNYARIKPDGLQKTRKLYIKKYRLTNLSQHLGRKICIALSKQQFGNAIDILYFEFR